MAPIKFSSILSVTSEDASHQACNLLGNDYKKKWKSAVWSESHSVVMKLSQPTRISSVQIGNNNSATVEIFVAKSSPNKKFWIERYHLLLPSFLFMTSLDSEQLSDVEEISSNMSINHNRVRFFGTDELSPFAVKENWDLVKVVCAQPFNKNISFGLSFIKLLSPEEIKIDADIIGHSSSHSRRCSESNEHSHESLSVNDSYASPTRSAASSSNDSTCSDENASEEATKVCQIPTKVEELIKSVLLDLQKWEKEVICFKGTNQDKEYKHLDEMLTRCMIRLDDIETDGIEDVRRARKHAIVCVQKCISLLDDKTKSNSTEETKNEEVEEETSNAKKVVKLADLERTV